MIKHTTWGEEEKTGWKKTGRSLKKMEGEGERLKQMKEGLELNSSRWGIVVKQYRMSKKAQLKIRGMLRQQ